MATWQVQVKQRPIAVLSSAVSKFCSVRACDNPEPGVCAGPITCSTSPRSASFLHSPRFPARPTVAFPASQVPHMPARHGVYLSACMTRRHPANRPHQHLEQRKPAELTPVHVTMASTADVALRALDECDARSVTSTLHGLLAVCYLCLPLALATTIARFVTPHSPFPSAVIVFLR